MSDSSSSEDDPDAAGSKKRLKTSNGSPSTFVTWNANGLVSRCTWNKDQLERLLLETDNPDLLCFQEVRLKSSSSTNRGTPHPSDYKSVREVMEATVFYCYDKYWSLDESKKYAGTLTLVHKRLKFSSQNAAFSMSSAISLLLRKYNLTRSDVGLPKNSFTDANGTNSSHQTKASPSKKQTSMKAFFAPKASQKKVVSTNAVIPEHHDEGRFQFFSFPAVDVIQTYSPNNGTKEESFQRRRTWDADMKEFLAQRRQILETAAAASADNQSLTLRPLLWAGDLNVAREYKDGTHWKKKGGSDDIYEFWTDETQCFAAGAAKKLDPNRHPDDRGIPSFTNNERRRFADILQSADLSDVWRQLHPDGMLDENEDASKYNSVWDRPSWTWRGHLSKDSSQFASKYQGKGQRLDYFLLSPSTLTSEIVESCDILGYGERREGHFCGSDHCAVLLKFKTSLD